jgi:putative tryptophan/tyrosine transport system substrate-binding protein
MRRREFLTLMGGAAATWPLTARGQQRSLPVIGFLVSRSAGNFPHLQSAFAEGLNEAGYVDGWNVMIEYRFGEGNMSLGLPWLDRQMSTTCRRLQCA